MRSSAIAFVVMVGVSGLSGFQAQAGEPWGRSIVTSGVKQGDVKLKAGDEGPADAHEQTERRIGINVIDGSLAEVLKAAGKEAKAQFTFDRHVDGPCTAFLYDVTFEQALDILLPHYDAVWYTKGGVIQILSQERYDELKKLGEIDEAKDEGPDAAPAEEAGEEDDNVEDEVDADEIKVEEAGDIELQVKNLQVEKVLQLLTLESKRNIVIAPDVGGDVTVHLKEVTFDQAVDHILTANGWRRIDREGYIWIITLEQWQAMQDQAGRAEE